MDCIGKCQNQLVEHFQSIKMMWTPLLSSLSLEYRPLVNHMSRSSFFKNKKIFMKENMIIANRFRIKLFSQYSNDYERIIYKNKLKNESSNDGVIILNYKSAIDVLIIEDGK